MIYINMEKINKVKIWPLAILLMMSFGAKAQNWQHTQDDIKAAVEVDTLKKKGWTLIWINKDKDFDPEVKNKMIDIFFKTYPKLAKAYNKETHKEVTFIIDPDYEGIAATAGGIIRYNPNWFVKNPEDIDVVTHELMHIVQSYPGRSGPGWITEGIADYVRFIYGIDNESANWTLPEVRENQSYDNSYRIAARFFHWIEKNIKKNFVRALDQAMRTKTYTEDFWEDETGLSVDELWGKYTQNPKI